MRSFHWLLSLLFLVLLVSCGRYQATDSWPPEDYTGPTPNELSEEILYTLKNEQDATPLIDQLAAYEPQDLAAALDTRNKKLAFWVNTYNAMVQYLLIRNPELYEDRGKFFSTESFTIAGHTISP
ncbi:MAG: DUF547 domain-containing protein, partial [Bacteroidota bacterium]